MLMRNATIRDLSTICKIFQDAKNALAAAGVDQWQMGYPNASSAEFDIAEGNGYVWEEKNVVAAYIVLQPGEELGYSKIFDGAWLTSDTPYATVHRVAVGAAYKRRGIARKMLNEAEKIVLSMGFSSLRVDTHEENSPMRSLLAAEGYAYCGAIRLQEGPDVGKLRLCYEKIIMS